MVSYNSYYRGVFMSEISINFTVSDEFLNHSNIVAETYLRNDSILLEKKHIISRIKISNELIKFDDFLEVNLLKSKKNALDLTIFIKYSKGSIYLKSSDSFAIKWFFDKLISNLEEYNKLKNSQKFVDNSNENYDNDIRDKKIKEFNNFLKKVNSPLSKKEQDSIRKKNKFYNHCLNEER